MDSGAADAFATDDVLLYGLVAQTLVRPGAWPWWASCCPQAYAVMFRKADPQLAKLVTDSMRAWHATARSTASTAAGSAKAARQSAAPGPADERAAGGHHQSPAAARSINPSGQPPSPSCAPRLAQRQALSGTRWLAPPHCPACRLVTSHC